MIILGVLVYIIGTIFLQRIAFSFTRYDYKTSRRRILSWKGRRSFECNCWFTIYNNRISYNKHTFKHSACNVHQFLSSSKFTIFTNYVRFSLDILFGIPSIVYGAFGFALMVYLGIRASLIRRNYSCRNAYHANNDAFAR